MTLTHRDRSVPGMIWRHVKTGGLYRLIGRGLYEKDRTHVVVYQGVKTRQIWVRSDLEFYDGRFELIGPDERPPETNIPPAKRIRKFIPRKRSKR